MLKSSSFGGVPAFVVLVLLVACDCGGDERLSPDGSPGGDAMVSGDAAVPPRDGPVSCDEETGEGCPCPAEGETRACETGGIGACGMGTQLCSVGFEFPVWGPCGGAAEPTDEECNGVDDDCDETVDEGFGDVSCGTGLCVATAMSCVAGVPQMCVPRSGSDEECNGEDDDCDESVDEGFGTISCGTGACAVTVEACAGGEPQSCTPGTPAAAEGCDGVDDDCDGAIDEDQGTTSCGVGACRVTVDACDGGTPAICTPLAAGTETCDGTDDDCDGTVDEGFGTVVCGVGECERIVLECSGTGTASCTPGTPAATDTCNGLDDDCDGATDEMIADVSCGVGACARTEAGCIGGSPNSCTPGSPSTEGCNGIDDDCDGATDEMLGTRSCGRGACRVTVDACVDGASPTCTPLPAGTEVCEGSVDEDCDGAIDEGCDCNVGVDGDFDGFNECVDCDDTNGGIFPGQGEICDGLDQDCDGAVDEDFDADGDTYSTCSTDPLQRDCDDSLATVNPGATEDCGPDEMGNGIDEDCNGRIDDTCRPCSDTDTDGDGYTECMGDCDEGDPTANPGAAEICDGKDTDCNLFTVDNCDVSEPCNFPDGTDQCRDDLLCGCLVDRRGSCTGDYLCTSFCQGSFTGELGAGCSDSQVCTFRISPTANAHGCGETMDTIGTLGAGAVCSDDAECRSGTCDRLCVGPGCMDSYCLDYCDHEEPGGEGGCAPGTVCEPRQAGLTQPYMTARCWLDDNGPGLTGDVCEGAGAVSCRWGTLSCVDGVCAEPCGLNSHCPSGYHCSLEGESLSLGTWAAGSAAAGETAIETVPVCLGDTGAGLHNRQAGSACSQNGDCASQFCEATRGICVDLCTSDSTCPTGLNCELTFMRTAAGVTQARVCVNATVEDVLEPM